jgi:hypothetical protein
LLWGKVQGRYRDQLEHAVSVRACAATRWHAIGRLGRCRPRGTRRPVHRFIVVLVPDRATKGL